MPNFSSITRSWITIIHSWTLVFGLPITNILAVEHTGLLTFFIFSVLVVIELNLINIIVLLLIDIIIFDLIGRKATSYVILSSPTLVL